jgi:hypothetical protein
MIYTNDAPLVMMLPYRDKSNPTGFINSSSYVTNCPTILSTRFYDGGVPVIVATRGLAHYVKTTKRPFCVLVHWILFGPPNFLD